MSDVKYSKRKKSRLEAQHMAYAIRKRITVELMASFALSQKRIEAYVESATKGIADISEREVTAKLLRELTMDRNVWFITKERDTVLDLCQGISRQLRMGNTVFPEYYSEFIERRLQLDVLYELSERNREFMAWYMAKGDRGEEYFVGGPRTEYAKVVVDHNKDFKEIETEELRKVFFTTKEECQAFCDYINGTEVLGYDYNVEGQLVAQREETE